jgi:hypothetical protein
MLLHIPAELLLKWLCQATCTYLAGRTAESICMKFNIRQVLGRLSTRFNFRYLAFINVK